MTLRDIAADQSTSQLDWPVLPVYTEVATANERALSALAKGAEPKGVTIFVYANNHYSGLP